MKTATVDRAAFSMAEFSKLFGKGVTWAYRQVYSGAVKPVTEYGRMLIPASEVERILATAGVYNGEKPKARKSKEEIQKLAPKLKNTWRDYLSKLRDGGASPSGNRSATSGKTPATETVRADALRRLAKARGQN